MEDKIREMYVADYSLASDMMVADIVKGLVAIGGRQEDEGYVTFTIPEGEGTPSYWDGRKSIGLTMFPALLDYYDGGNWVKRMWVKVRMELTGPSHDTHSSPRGDEMLDEEMRQAARYIRDELLAEFQYEPFSDEDAYLGSFSKERDRENGQYRVSLFFNPAYPDGVWHNHTL